ncbi:hypothetical protein BS50DRAFT_514045 [Corynespora cassiicola Philippines]|uniref:superoxide dismutase n=1 Tax=Corynespora cassiicola Philippines TaxID=1448308 RepID=A0A2T2P5S9_CORCC|nr:hypothetical protein BS50DRAFT_514045 [Corynespora cassiicola Philippines]
MLAQSILSVFALAAAVGAQSSSVTPAPLATGNPRGAVYVANVKGKGGLIAEVHATTGKDGNGVEFTVNVQGLPAEGGPFMYHLHEKRVPEDGNCTATGAHIDPYKRGEVPICDESKPETCQTGDLSGKFGNITEQSWSQVYTDLYSSTIPGTPAFFGDLSVVFHLSNKTRIGCANFQGGDFTPSGTAGSSGIPQPTGTGHFGNGTSTVAPTSTGSATGTPVAPSEPAQQTTNAAQKLVAGGAGVVLAAMAFAL